jgi:hypothetical protein
MERPAVVAAYGNGVHDILDPVCAAWAKHFRGTSRYTLESLRWLTRTVAMIWVANVRGERERENRNVGSINFAVMVQFVPVVVDPH